MSNKSVPKIDYTRLHFPSDSVTIGNLRKIDRRLDLDEPKIIDAVGMLAIERILARQAFYAALNLPDENPFGRTRSRLDWVDILTDDYKAYGIAKGPKTSLKLIEALEADAAAQAREHLGIAR